MIPSVKKLFSLSFFVKKSEAQEQASRPISLSWSSFLGMIKRVYTAQHLLVCVGCGLQRQRRAVDPGQNSLGDPLEVHESRFKFCVCESTSTPDRRPSTALYDGKYMLWTSPGSYEVVFKSEWKVWIGICRVCYMFVCYPQGYCRRPGSELLNSTVQCCNLHFWRNVRVVLAIQTLPLRC